MSSVYEACMGKSICLGPEALIFPSKSCKMMLLFITSFAIQNSKGDKDLLALHSITIKGSPWLAIHYNKNLSRIQKHIYISMCRTFSAKPKAFSTKYENLKVY